MKWGYFMEQKNQPNVTQLFAHKIADLRVLGEESIKFAERELVDGGNIEPSIYLFSEHAVYEVAVPCDKSMPPAQKDIYFEFISYVIKNLDIKILMYFSKELSLDPAYRATLSEFQLERVLAKGLAQSPYKVEVLTAILQDVDHLDVISKKIVRNPFSKQITGFEPLPQNNHYVYKKHHHAAHGQFINFFAYQEVTNPDAIAFYNGHLSKLIKMGLSIESPLSFIRSLCAEPAPRSKKRKPR